MCRNCQYLYVRMWNHDTISVFVTNHIRDRTVPLSCKNSNSYIKAKKLRIKYLPVKVDILRVNLARWT